MTNTDTIARLVIAMGEAYRQRISETTINAYRLGLAGLTEDQLQQAGGAALQRCKFMPSPAELRELAGIKTDSDRAIQAWAEFQQAVPLGPYKHLDFADSLINATVRNLGGWPNLLSRLGSAEDEKWVRQEFCKTYASFERTGVDGKACEPLPGLAEASVVEGQIVAPQILRIAAGGDIKRIAAPPSPRISDKQRLFQQP